MASIVSLDLTFSGGTSAARSARLVCEVLATRDGLAQTVAERFPDFFEPGVAGLVSQPFFDASNLFRIEPIDGAALRAGEIVLNPADRYVDFVTAIAGGGDVSCDFDAHGWPILSLGCCVPIVADGGGAGNAPAGGLAS